jgi:hypothetical protein
MSITANELRSQGAAVAKTEEGFELPVLDVTHPRFAVPEDADSMRRLNDRLASHERRHRMLPAFVLRHMLGTAAKRSRLMRAMFQPDSDFLDGLITYVMKLGPDNLMPPYDSEFDKRFARAPQATLMRLRTQQVARMLADAIRGALDGDHNRPLHLINIAGGPSIDSLNALILLARRSDGLLRRQIVIHILDLQQAAPVFGQNALTELKKPDFPLHGLDIEIRRAEYDWNNAAPLAGLLKDVRGRNAAIVASSEGGLFEYGSDEAIVRNLEMLRDAGALAVVGSVTRADPESRRRLGADRFKVVPRGREGIAPLVDAAGFRIGETAAVSMSIQAAFVPALQPA